MMRETADPQKKPTASTEMPHNVLFSRRKREMVREKLI